MKPFSNPGRSTTHANPEREWQLLLDLGNDLANIHEKRDLIVLFSERIKPLMPFTHTIITLIDCKDQTYSPFLPNQHPAASKDHSGYEDHSGYGKIVKARFPLGEPLIESVLAADGPVDFNLAGFADAAQSPPFLQVNFEKGIGHVLMTTLRTGDQPIGFLHVYTDREEGFPRQFRDIVRMITPQLSAAISNIIRSEQILQKESENSFLLDFSNAMTGVRSRDDLALVVKKAFGKLNPGGGYVIRKINADGITMSAYLHDTGPCSFDKDLLEQVLAEKFPIGDGIQNRIMDSHIPLLFDVQRELQRGYRISYLDLWEQMGFKTMVGIALRNGDTNVGLLLLSIDRINIPILQGICSQIAIAMGNIMANEEILRRQSEQQLMLTFSNQMTGVKTKAELDDVISGVLHGLFQTRVAVLYLLAEDQLTLRPYLFDKRFFQEDDIANHEDFYSLSINEEHVRLVFESNLPILLEIDENTEARCLKLSIQRKQRGLTNVYASALRLGDQKLGMVWMLGEKISEPLLQAICAQISTAVSNVLANEQILLLKKQLEEENAYLKQQLRTNFDQIVGSGQAMQQVYRLISLVAESNATVLLLGETGTGKELIAKAIHNASERKGKLMIKVNCAAMPAGLIESELFGHERGAFTGAVERRIGKFELANQSTLFLDEVGEMPPETQVKLLRVLQEKEMERVGGKNTIKLNVRIIAATNRDLEAEVKAGRFRLDLYYRLNVFPIKLPPLRDRREDIEALAGFFLSKFSKSTGRKTVKLSANALRQLQAYLWPGNVRELEHLIERSVLVTTDPMIGEFFLPQATTPTTNAPLTQSDLPLEEVERMHIIQVLRRCGGKISGVGGAAGILGIPGNTLHSKIRKLGISKADYYTH
ncbi:sigma-54-dependent Fis family transcriptional regulator [Xanthocytophaga agilis]|uniref:Sigma 54-interacting transcriptional regulator n=1 Tax=Xanthocytophaga agilis TaxID=3048010 RepID=A0AAE3UEJ0_9BACT|nr:sigma 54-interacting transcriptional regulator [Xanthocytophaga agilis]MDJ1500312.1 sigma 54-interacting transcriptional regulator [Xanthocytophaga agilis]